MNDEDDKLKAILAKDMVTIEKYFEQHMEEKFEMHGMTLVMLLFKAKISVLAELQHATRQAWAADQAAAKATTDLIDNLKRNAK